MKISIATAIVGRGLVLAAAGLLALVSAPAEAGKAGRMSTPAIGGAGATPSSALVQVCAAASGTGATAGFSLQWMPAADAAANGGAW
jgi:hypothetical protein